MRKPSATFRPCSRNILPRWLNKRLTYGVVVGLALNVGVAIANAASGQTFTTLHSLSSAEGSGINNPLVRAADGNFYGIAQQGGAANQGTFFRITPAGVFTLIHSFGSGAGDVSYPVSLMQAADGNFYGMSGTLGGAGEIFKITAAGAVTIIHSFNPDYSEGVGSLAPLIQAADGTFYGSTYQGGDGGINGSGTLFKFTTDGTAAGTAFTTVHYFPPQSGGINDGGADPSAAMLQAPDGNLYGTTFSGGANGRGTIFKLTPAGDFTTLYVFTRDTGGESRGALVRDNSGVFYGTSSTGPTQGAVYKMTTDGTPAGTQVSVLYDFGTQQDDSDGGGLDSGVVIAPDGYLYGTTDLGGANGNGTIFRLKPGGPFETLHAFSSNSSEAPSHEEMVLGSDGNLYGTTFSTIFVLEIGAQSPPPGSSPPPAPPAPEHGGLSATVFRVNDSDTPAGGVADTALHFTAQQSGTPAGLKVRVQINTVANNDRTDWVDLPNGSQGYMTIDKTTAQFVLDSTNYPRASGIYFRALSTASGYPDSKSNIIGPFDLTGAQSHLGATTLFIATNGPGAEMNFHANVAVDQAAMDLHVQATTSPADPNSWADLSDGQSGEMHPFADPKQFYLNTTKYPPGDAVYFRAVATAPGFLKSISNIVGVNNVIVGTPPDVEITPPRPEPGSKSGEDAKHPIVVSPGPIHFSAEASSPEHKSLKRVGLIFDGATIAENDGGSTRISVDYVADVAGDHVIKAFATDARGITGYADPVYIRIPPRSGKVFTMTRSGDWSTARNWRDNRGNIGVPAENDLAIIDGQSASIARHVNVFAVSLLSGSIDGAGGGLTIPGFFSVAGGQLHNLNLTIDTHGTLSLVGDDNVPMSGQVTNYGTIRITGKGGIVPVTNNSGAVLSNASHAETNGLFDGVAAFFKNVGDFIFHRPSVKPKPTPPPTSPPPVAQPRGVTAAGFVNQGRLITNDGGSLITNDGGSLITNDGATIIGNDGASLITNDGGSLITNDGGSLITNDGGSLITNDGGSLRVRPNGANSGAITQAQGAASGFVQSGGEIDLHNLLIIAPLTIQGGVVSGSGVIAGTVENKNGFISPGHSAGAISVLGNFTQKRGGTLIVENGGIGAGDSDFLQVTGTANLGGNLEVRATKGYTPKAVDTFSPLAYGAVSGKFASVSSNAHVTFDASGMLVTNSGKAPQPSAGILANISTRLRVQTGDDVLIGGFIVSGPAGSSKKVLIRALGPSLAHAGIHDALSDPLLELHKPDGSIISNDNWRQGKDRVPPRFQPKSDKESAIVATIPVGKSGLSKCTAIVKGAHGEKGIALVEVYDLDDSSAAELGNISTRGLVQTGDDVMIGGVIVDGKEPAKVLVRAIGPTLRKFGLRPTLKDPLLELHDANGAVISNDNWRETQEREIKATGLAPKDEHESAIIATLVPGNYTAIVRGKNDASGLALVEAYKVQ